MEYEEILKILGCYDNFFGYMKELECKFYKIKEEINKYDKEIVDDFIKNEGYKFLDNIDSYIKEKEIFEKYVNFYKDKYKHKILYKKFKEGIVFTDEEIRYIINKGILYKIYNNTIFLDNTDIDDLMKVSKIFPKSIKIFNCINNENLKNLKGSPEKVKEYYCYECGLISLEGAPKKVRIFDCSYNKDLTNLIGGPNEVEEEYNCSNCNLESLKGAPRKVKIFKCSNNYNLTDLKDGPNEVEEEYNCSNCNLESLKGAPRKVKIFKCDENYDLINLKGGPEEAEEEYDCSYCGLTSLEGAPRKVKIFNCKNNNRVYKDGSKLKNLVGGPEEVEEEYNCMNCDLESLEGLAKKIGVLKCDGNKFDKEYVKKFIKENNIEVKEIIM